MKFSKRALAVGTAVLVAAGGTSAFAYFTDEGTGTGNGSVSATSAADIQLAAAAEVTSLKIGVPTDVAVTAWNDGTEDTTVESVGPDTTAPFTSGVEVLTSPGTCNAAWFTITPLTGLAVAVPESSTSASPVSVGNVKLTLMNLPVSQNGCKGATIKLHIKTPA